MYVYRSELTLSLTLWFFHLGIPSQRKRTFDHEDRVNAPRNPVFQVHTHSTIRTVAFSELVLTPTQCLDWNSVSVVQNPESPTRHHQLPDTSPQLAISLAPPDKRFGPLINTKLTITTAVLLSRKIWPILLPFRGQQGPYLCRCTRGSHLLMATSLERGAEVATA
jgi:hypothetical protein